MISGFRLSLGGASERYGVTPDLAVYGKALAGGFPVSALAGSAELMAPFGTGAVTHAGTFNASVMAMAAVVASLQHLRDELPYARVEAHGRALREGLLERARAHGVPLRLQGVPMAFHASFGVDAEVHDARGLEALDRAGYWRSRRRLARPRGVGRGRRHLVHVGAPTASSELEAVLGRVDEAFAQGAAA